MKSIPDCAGWILDEYDGPRFWQHVRLGGKPYATDKLATATGECWLWNGELSLDGSYATFRFAGRCWSAHRVAYRDFGNDLPEELRLDHLCRITRCVNPSHLEPVSQAENVRRGLHPLDNRAACKNGHEFTAENTYIRTTPPIGGRHCRACDADRQAIRRAAKRATNRGGDESGAH